MSKEWKPLGKIFRSLSGRNYAYMTETNQIFTLSSGRPAAVTDEAGWEEGVLSRIAQVCGMENRIPDSFCWPLERDAYRRRLSSGLRSLVLEITQQCSLRCCYCIYSGRYKGRRTHSELTMSERTMLRSIEYYAEHSTDAAEADISFYGGEALLHFDLICGAVEHAKHCFKGKRLSFRISSNGTTLTESVAQWLEEQEEVSLTVTLNGPFHDRYRRFPSGQCSLDCIMQNLNQIRKNHPKVWNRIHFLANIAREEEMLGLRDFYREQIGMPPTLVTGILDYGGNAEIHKITRDGKSRERYIREMHRLYCEEMDAYIRPYYRLDVENLCSRTIGAQEPCCRHAACCMPFTVSLFVAADGTLGLCERTEPSEYLGNISRGISVKAAEDIMDQALAIFHGRCRFCWARRLCTVCFQDMDWQKRKLFLPDEICWNQRRQAASNLAVFCELAERNPAFVERMQRENIRSRKASRSSGESVPHGNGTALFGSIYG